MIRPTHCKTLSEQGNGNEAKERWSVECGGQWVAEPLGIESGNVSSQHRHFVPSSFHIAEQKTIYFQPF
jgi:hypothetical protein